jgi:hypothetical protein
MGETASVNVIASVGKPSMASFVLEHARFASYIRMCRETVLSKHGTVFSTNKNTHLS